MTNVHPDLELISWLLGTWRGRGTGTYPTIDAFEYVEEATFDHVGKPFLAYSQKTRDATSDLPLHAESGYVRPVAGGMVEFVVSQPSGIIELHAGAVDGESLELHSTTVLTTPTAKAVSAVVRRFRVVDDQLEYEVDMAAVGQPMLPHLRAELRRATH